MAVNKLILAVVAVTFLTLYSCSSSKLSEDNEKEVADASATEADKDTFTFDAGRFADLQILRYKVPGFDELTDKQKELAFYLYQAALSGRDMIWDQRYKNNLYVRRTLEGIWENNDGSQSVKDWENFQTYAKRVWFSNGIHHHYSTLKIQPEFGATYLRQLIEKTPDTALPLDGMTKAEFADFIVPVITDPKIAAKGVVKEKGVDWVSNSANNFYEGVTTKEVEAYYSKMLNQKDMQPVMYGLNSKLVKNSKGQLEERVWKADGMYAPAIQKVNYWLEKAANVAENPQQERALRSLIKYYKSGDLKDFDEYNIAWVEDTDSRIDVVNGFIEVYGDPLGKRGSFESVVSMRDMEATKRIAAIAKEAQWFEDNSPLEPMHKKEEVKGISAKVITAIVESGDAAPSTPIGINLPNSNWIRAEHGSKSVNLGNIVYAYNQMKSKSPVMAEFAPNMEVLERIKQYGGIAGDLHTDMHEVIGHASGKLEPGVSPPDVTLKTYANTLEEARADLVALYYILDEKLVDISVMPTTDVGKAEYDRYIINGMMLQLNRIALGDQIEEAHMRNRQLISKWAYEKGKADNVIEKYTDNGKTYFKINDYNKLRTIFGKLLAEIQRIKSQGDYAAAENLVEGYGVMIDRDLHKEVLARYEKLDVAPYSGFIQPRLVADMTEDGRPSNVRVEYPTNFAAQMLRYGKEYSYLPNKN